MTRLVWYQHRVAVVWLMAVSTALAMVLTIAGVIARAQYATEVRHGCIGRGSGPIVLGGPACQHAGAAFPWLNVYQAGPGAAGGIFPYGIWLTTQVLIVATGMFLGAPLLAREYEQGTFRFAWTQGMGRTRWCAIKLNVLGVLVVLFAAALGALASWSFQPFNSLWGDGAWRPAEFVTGSATAAGWALLAFMVGVVAGALFKRAVAAAAATAVTLTVLLGLAHTPFHRMLPVSPLTLPGGGGWLAQAVAGAGLVAAALLLGAVTLWLVRSRGARTRGRQPAPG